MLAIKHTINLTTTFVWLEALNGSQLLKTLRRQLLRLVNIN